MDRVIAYEQPFGDSLIAQAFRHQTQYFEFALGEIMASGRWGRGFTILGCAERL
jgi:hypothetical protein